MDSIPGANKSHTTSNPEDINSVLGRFQQWADTQSSRSSGPMHSARSARASGAKTGSPQRTRESSYEDALRASSYRRTVSTVTTTAATASFGSAPSPAKEKKLEPELKSQPAIPVSSRTPSQASSEFSDLPASEAFESAPGATKSAAKRAKSPASQKPSTKKSPNAQKSRQRRSSKAEMLAAGQPKKRNTTRASSTAVHLRADMPQFAVASSRATRVITASSATQKPEPTVSSVMQQLPVVQPVGNEASAFREVFEQSAGLTTANRSTGITDNRSVALSLRVSETEHARIIACATRANLSVSAYLRQCALGVDELRGQVAAALGELQKVEAKTATPSGSRIIPARLAQFASRCFHRFTGQPTPSSVSLR
jgi:hypothetical protein